MKKIKVAINGFGRIGRSTAKLMLNNNAIELVAINDLSDNATLANLFKYDSVHGKYKGSVTNDDTSITIEGNKIKATAERDPEKLPWKNLEVDVVIESTGHFRTPELAGKHITAGAKKVILSAPAKSGDIKTIVLGVNDHELDGAETIISNASCTTNCAAPMIKVIDELCGIKNGFLSTIHSYTSVQNLHDGPHKDIRRGRAATLSIIPTTTGAATAVTQIFTHLEGKIIGSANRVPVPDGSLTELTLNIKNPKTIEEINAAFKKASQNEMKHILEYNEDPIVSVDILRNENSCIFDSTLTQVLDNSIKICGWYDNEIGYSSRLVDLVLLVSNN
ncbi:MAG: type I glyceraldehyde-3-phosphate dehydrogenase [Flavobacteriales bacterium]|nr:type I glyceraldehyde-3-phosphate dehydrogenase [Flavobacteriales bacterium]